MVINCGKTKFIICVYINMFSSFVNQELHFDRIIRNRFETLNNFLPLRTNTCHPQIPQKISWTKIEPFLTFPDVFLKKCLLQLLFFFFALLYILLSESKQRKPSLEDVHGNLCSATLQLELDGLSPCRNCLSFSG